MENKVSKEERAKIRKEMYPEEYSTAKKIFIVVGVLSFIAAIFLGGVVRDLHGQIRSLEEEKEEIANELSKIDCNLVDTELAWDSGAYDAAYENLQMTEVEVYELEYKMGGYEAEHTHEERKEWGKKREYWRRMLLLHPELRGKTRGR